LNEFKLKKTIWFDDFIGHFDRIHPSSHIHWFRSRPWHLDRPKTSDKQSGETYQQVKQQGLFKEKTNLIKEWYPEKPS
jgi:hypothetical protein